MYIRRTLTRSLPTGEQYYSHRLVRSERIGGRVRQVTLLNLGQNFVVAPNHWETLCARIQEVLAGQVTPVALVCESAIEGEAQRLAALLLTRQARVLPLNTQRTLESLDVDSLEVVRARSVGVESVALWATRELRLNELLQGLGMSQRQVSATVGMVVGRMAAPGAERAILSWWGERSAIGELLGVDFAAFSLSLLVRAGDGLLKCRRTLEKHVFERLSALFALPAGEPTYNLRLVRLDSGTGEPIRVSLSSTVGTLGDVTCCSAELVTLGLEMDGSGFVRRSASAVDQVVTGSTLRKVLDQLGAHPGALVTVDRALADEASLGRLKADGFRVLAATSDQAHALPPVISLPAPGPAVPDGEAFAAAQLLISVLAYQCVQIVRRRLRVRGIDAGWPVLRQTLDGQCRVTTSFRLGDGRTLHVRQATRADSEQLAIYQALGIDPAAGAVQKTLI